MRDPELELLSWVLFGGLCWLIFHFYWLRVLTCAVGLAVWGASVIALPIFLAWRYLQTGHPILAVIGLLVCVIPAGLFCVAAAAAMSWVKAQSRYGRLWQTWNAT